MKGREDSVFREEILTERIEMITKRIRIRPEDEADYRRGDEIIASLDEGIRASLERYLEIRAEHGSQVEEATYLGGFKDGVRLTAELLLIAFEEEEGGQE